MNGEARQYACGRCGQLGHNARRCVGSRARDRILWRCQWPTCGALVYELERFAHAATRHDRGLTVAQLDQAFAVAVIPVFDEGGE